ncbi:MAG: endonuclease III domain-containing protein [Eubacterium ramulus]
MQRPWLPGQWRDIYHFDQINPIPNNKAKHLHEMAQKLERDFQGKVPEDMELLQTLPGVGRKTANVVMAVAFTNQPCLWMRMFSGYLIGSGW